MKKTALALLAFALSGTVAGAQTIPARLAVLTFNQTAAAQTVRCQTMIAAMNAYRVEPRSMPADVLAIDAYGCLRAVQYETDDPLAAEVPRAILEAACYRALRDDPTEFRENLRARCAVLNRAQ